MEPSLAHAELAQLEKQAHDLEDAREIMMYLRHEAGHAFTYAYKLHNKPEWKQMFGPFRRPYRDKYRPAPLSRSSSRSGLVATVIALALIVVLFVVMGRVATGDTSQDVRDVAVAVAVLIVALRAYARRRR